jgi:hypothetical protein
MHNADEAIKWILVLDLVIMSIFLVKTARDFEKQQKEKK